MRATYLQFRNPKEPTGEFLYIGMTADGKSLKYKPKDYLKSSFPKSQRWEHIRQLACRTSFKVGPGSYNTPLTTNKGRSARIEKDATFIGASGNWDYVYIGDALVKKERPSSRGNGMTPRYSYQKDRNESSYSSRYAGVEGNFSEVTSKQRPLSAGRQRVEYQYSRESPSPRRSSPSHRIQNNGSPINSERHRSSSTDYYHSKGIPYGKRIYPADNYQNQAKPSSAYSPVNKQKTPGSPTRSALKPTRSLKGDELLNVKEKDFYAALQEQWGMQQKIVIHNDRPPSRSKNRGDRL